MIPSFANLSHFQFGTSLGGTLAKSLHGLCSSSYLKTSEHAISRCKSWPRNRGDVFLRSDRRRVIVRHPEINRFDVSRGKSMQRPLGTSAPLHVGIQHARIHERANAYVKKLKAIVRLHCFSPSLRGRHSWWTWHDATCSCAVNCTLVVNVTMLPVFLT